MRPDNFGHQLAVAVARTTPAFQSTSRPARQGFVRQLVDALARVTPAFQVGPPPAEPPSPGGGPGLQPQPGPSEQPSARRAPRRAPQRSVNDGRYLSVAEVASLMRISKGGVFRLVHSGHLPAVRVGRSFRIPERAVHDYLQERVRQVS